VLPTEVLYVLFFLCASYLFYYSLLGYLLALILEACIQFQSTTAHIDPIHITAHYLRTTFAAPFTICIRSLKTGSDFTNLSAELMQEVIQNCIFIPTNRIAHFFVVVLLLILGYREDNDTYHLWHQRASSQG
jgi:hypothetical protein